MKLGAMGHTAVGVKSGELFLDGVVTTPDGLNSRVPGVVVCHPHPVFAGNMDNTIVVYICETLAQAGIASLRFNFRSVGKQQATVTKGLEEREDVQAALNMLKAWPKQKVGRLGLAGYSFGASVILSGFKMYKEAKAFAFISPPLPGVKAEEVGSDKRPRLFIVGERDKLVKWEELRKRVGSFERPAEVQSVPGADHSWRGHEAELAERVVDFFLRSLA